MLTTAEAWQRIRDAMALGDAERIPIAQAPGRVLREPVHAERDQPPFDRVTMDGIAIRHADFAAGARRFPIVATSHAGDARATLDDEDSCIEVMTGAVLPDGTDTVIAVERISVADGTATLEPDYTPEQGQYVHRRGSDHRRGTEVLSPGCMLTPVDVAVLASCGLERVSVTAAPVVRVISTGNELVEAGAPIADHQVRLSNGPALVAMLADTGFGRSAHVHLRDDKAVLEQRIGELLAEANVLILSGGVSMGKADFVPQVLEELGVEVIFHKIAQRPGKPMWFGKGPAGQSVFALPGNPVSSVVCCRQYVLPALYAAAGRKPAATAYAALAETVEFRPSLTCFLPVTIESGDDAQAVARPEPTNTSGDFTALSGTDGYVELARDTERFEAGTVVPFHAWDKP